MVWETPHSRHAILLQWQACRIVIFSEKKKVVSDSVNDNVINRDIAEKRKSKMTVCFVHYKGHHRLQQSNLFDNTSVCEREDVLVDNANLPLHNWCRHIECPSAIHTSAWWCFSASEAGMRQCMASFALENWKYWPNSQWLVQHNFAEIHSINLNEEAALRFSEAASNDVASLSHQCQSKMYFRVIKRCCSLCGGGRIKNAKMWCAECSQPTYTDYDRLICH